MLGWFIFEKDHQVLAQIERHIRDEKFENPVHETRDSIQLFITRPQEEAMGPAAQKLDPSKTGKRFA